MNIKECGQKKVNGVKKEMNIKKEDKICFKDEEKNNKN